MDQKDKMPDNSCGGFQENSFYRCLINSGNKNVSGSQIPQRDSQWRMEADQGLIISAFSRSPVIIQQISFHFSVSTWAGSAEKADVSYLFLTFII